MWKACGLLLGLWMTHCLCAAPSAQGIAAALRELSIDATQTYHVRDLRLTRGDIKFYFNEGYLAFTKPIAGRPTAAVFSAADVEGGDAEIILLPPSRGERASLASFAKSPNLDEHFLSAAFLFTDATFSEVLRQIEEQPARKVPEATAASLATSWNSVLRNLAEQTEVRFVSSLLDDLPEKGFFHGVIAGRAIGTFDVTYHPQIADAVLVGRVMDGRFQIWTSFAPRRPRGQAAAPPVVPAPLSDFQIEATIHPDLRLSAVARFTISSATESGRVLDLEMSDRMKILSATVDGQSAEVFQRQSIRNFDEQGVSTFLVIADSPLLANRSHRVEVRYEGSVIEKTASGAYFVAARNIWFPYHGAGFTNFDMLFRYPSNLHVVSTGDLVSEEVQGDLRITHTRTSHPVRFAGFNLGDYQSASLQHGPLRIECYGNKGSALPAPSLSQKNVPPPSSGNLALEPQNRLTAMSHNVAQILDEYSKMWGPLPIQRIAVSPIPGAFGQGFPGLIYLSTLAYLSPEERRFATTNESAEIFFSDMLLAHEVAHQWWGNLVTAADYRSEWLMEALAHYSALMLLEKNKGTAAVEQALLSFRDNLLRADDKGQSVEAAGSLDLGFRIREGPRPDAWRVITYEKGAWVLHMLRQRLGPEGYQKLLARIIADFRYKPISNEEFRKLASEFVPPNQPDRSLEVFFESWVYSSGLPKLHLASSQQRQGAKRFLTASLSQEGVDEGFSVDVPLRVSGTNLEFTSWIRSHEETIISLPSKAPDSKVQLPRPTDFLYNPQQ